MLCLVVMLHRRVHSSLDDPRRGGIGSRWATLDLSGPYRLVFDTMLPTAVRVADPFHVVKLAGSCVDEVRRWVQNETCRHRCGVRARS